MVRALANLGVTRASLGVQDFTPAVQRAMGRVQPFDLVKRITGDLRDAGIEAINFDLMYGLPNQTVMDAACTASLATSLGPDRIALFGYAHVPWFKAHQRLIDSSSLPGASERLAQSAGASETLHRAGYIPVGLDHFALPHDPLAVAAKNSTLRRNFQGYTTDQAPILIGLGASAIGQMPQGYVQNAPDVAGYSRAINSGRFATVRGLALSNEDRVRAAIIERLMCEFTVDLAEFSGR
jgi:oxygen-independent coproporphyrinogen-3 oxidase